MRREWMLLSFGLVVIAALILYSALHTPDMRVSSVPQTQTHVAESTEKSRYCIRINEATREELLGMRYINERLADAILLYREENGDFLREEELMEVPGIGEKTLEKIRPYILVD